MSSLSTLSISISPSKMYQDDTMDEGICRDSQIMVSDISRGSLVSENNEADHHAGCPTYDEGEDSNDCCPICYEVYAIHPSSTRYPMKGDEECGNLTLSTHHEHFDYDSDESKPDFDAIDTGTKIEINIDVDHHLQPGSSLYLPSSISTNNSSTEDCPEYKCSKYPKGEHKTFCDQHRKVCCDPSEKVSIPGCGHGFCRGCLKDHCSYAISIRDLPIRCPKHSGDDSSIPCSATLPTDIVREALLMEEPTNRDWIKFQRLERMLEDPSLISCTRCDELIAPDQDKSDKSNNHDDPNRIECPSCQHVFCRVHGDGHLVRDCSEASLHHDESDPSELAILELCKPCSHCGVPICKEEGCNHVVCPVCKDDMCFKCGSHEHLERNGKTVRICTNCNGSYFDHRYLWWHRLGVLAKLPLMLPIYVGYMAMTLALATLSCGCFCCLGCGVRVKETTKKNQHAKREKSSFFKRIVFMPLMAVREVLGFLLLPFIDLFRECRIPCCFCHNAPGLCKGRPMDEDDDDEDPDWSHSDDVDTVGRDTTEKDVENQLGEP